MSSGPSVVLVLEGDNAVLKNRDIMATNQPKQLRTHCVLYMLAASVKTLSTDLILWQMQPLKSLTSSVILKSTAKASLNITL